MTMARTPLAIALVSMLGNFFADIGEMFVTLPLLLILGGGRFLRR